MRRLNHAHARLRRRIDDALQRLGNGEAGAVDLASIMVGILVLGVVAGIIAATVFGVIPWSQDNAASQDLDAVKTAESIYRAEHTEEGGPAYVIDFNGVDPNAPTLVSEGLLHRKSSLVVVTSNAGDAYIGISTSPTGNKYYLTSDGITYTRKAGDPVPAAVTDFAGAHGNIVLPYEPAPSGGITSMWAWENPLTTDQDVQGKNDPNSTAANLVTYAIANNLTDIRISPPWAADTRAPFAQWLNESVLALRAAHVNVQAVGGQSDWVGTDNATIWIDAASRAASFDEYDIDIEPWVGDDGWKNDPAKIGAFVSLISKAATAAHSHSAKLSVDAPWWLANVSYNGSTALSTIAGQTDEVNIITFEDSATTIISESQNAVDQTVAAGKRFYIGVSTEAPTKAGGAEFTFGDDGETALQTEVGKVRAHYTGTAGYKGVAVQDYASWRTLS